MDKQSAPSITELKNTARRRCSAQTLKNLLGRVNNTNRDRKSGNDDANASSSGSTSVGDNGIILVNRRSRTDTNRVDAIRLNNKYAHQYKRNCFYQFRNIRDTRHSYFGLPDVDDGTSDAVSTSSPPPPPPPSSSPSPSSQSQSSSSEQTQYTNLIERENKNKK